MKETRLKRVKAESTWWELFGRKEDEISRALRRKRWEKWKSLNIEKDKKLVSRWTKTTKCKGCEFISEDWCILQGLPCTVDPRITFSTGKVGMACRGVIYNSKRQQKKL